MNDNVILLHLTDFITWSTKHQAHDSEYRKNWRYLHKRAEIGPKRADALRRTEAIAARLHQAIADPPEPTYYTRTSREILELWNRYRGNHAIMLEEYNPQNVQHERESRIKFQFHLKELAQKLSKKQQ